MPEKVIHVVPMNLLDRADDLQFRAKFIYNPFDPFAVQLRILKPMLAEKPAEEATGQPIDWFFARESLRRGSRSPQFDGEGDIAFRRWSSFKPKVSELHIQLYPQEDSQRTTLRTPLRGVKAFLSHTAEVVPYGKEQEIFNALLERHRNTYFPDEWPYSSGV